MSSDLSQAPGVPASVLAQLMGKITKMFSDVGDVSKINIIEAKQVSPLYDMIMFIPKLGGGRFGLFGKKKEYFVVAVGKVGSADQLIDLVNFLSDQKGKYEVGLITYSEFRVESLMGIEKQLPNNVEGLAVTMVSEDPKLITIGDVTMPLDALIELAGWIHSENKSKMKKIVDKRAEPRKGSRYALPKLKKPGETLQNSQETPRSFKEENYSSLSIPKFEENRATNLTSARDVKITNDTSKSYLEPTPKIEREVKGEIPGRGKLLSPKFKRIDVEEMVKEEIMKLKLDFVKGKVDLADYRRRLKELQERLTLILKFSKLLKEKGVEGIKEKKEELKERLKVLQELKEEGYSLEDLTKIERSIKDELKALEELEKSLLELPSEIRTEEKPQSESLTTSESEEVPIQGVEAQEFTTQESIMTDEVKAAPQMTKEEIAEEVVEDEFGSEILKRLERMYREGKISREMYERLKKKYESI